MEENEEWIMNNSSLAVSTIQANLEDGVVSSLDNGLTATTISNCNIDIKATTLSGEVDRMKSYLEKIKRIKSESVGNYTDQLFWTL